MDALKKRKVLREYDILRKKEGNYEGKQLVEIDISSLTKEDCEYFFSLKKLERIPKKISSFFKKENIKTVYKAEAVTNPYYIILDKNENSFFARFN